MSYLVPSHRREAQEYARQHLDAARNTANRPRFTFRLVNALLGIGYAVLAVTLDNPGESDG